ncbi:MAG: InlB B-repeat-containing protein [Oscillospiraceae bacterium]|nr:InlB B-repeat-containing protein [Candidatus Ruminococcus equi]
MIKKLLALAVVFVLIFSTVSFAVSATINNQKPNDDIAPVSADTTAEKKDATKTAKWLNDAKTSAEIDIASTFDKKITDGKILFLGSLCSAHALTKGTVANSLTTCAKYADVDYYLYSVNNELESDKNTPITGTLKKNSTFTEAMVTTFNKSRHSCLYEFANVLVNKWTKDYDLVVMEFDGIRMGMFSATITNTMKSNLLKAAIKLKSLYADGKVVWIIPDKSTVVDDDSSTKKYNAKYIYNEYYLNHTSNSYNKNVYDCLALVAPEDWLNSQGTARKDYPTSYNDTLLESLTTLKNRCKVTDTVNNSGDIWVPYDKSEKVSAFLESKMLGHGYEEAIITDTVADGFKIESVKGEYYDTKTATYKEMAQGKFTKKIEGQKVTGTFDVTDLDVANIRLTITVSVLTGEDDPFIEDEVVDTNVGDAVIEYYHNEEKINEEKLPTPNLEKKKFTVDTTVVNGTITDDTTVYEGEDVTITYSPDEFYELDKITVDGTPLTPQQMALHKDSYKFSDLDKDHTIKVEYKLVKHTVTFESNGGSSVQGQTVTHGDKATEPEDPTKTGYTFTKWYKDEGLTEEWKFDTDTVLEDTVLYADYLEDTHTLTYDANGGENAPLPQEMKISAAAYVSENEPTRDGYTFYGWATSKEKADAGTVEYEPEDLYLGENVEKADATLYAVWSENDVTISYVATTGGSVTNDEDVVKVFSGEPDGSTAVADEGYHFVNWINAEGDEVSKDETFVPTQPKEGFSATTYTAVFEINKYDVTFDMQGHGEQEKPQTVDHGSYAERPTDPEEEGYGFIGWSSDPDTYVEFDFEKTPITEDTIIYAFWLEKTATLTYDANGGENAPKPQTLKYTEEADITLDEPTRDGYTFEGWSSTSTGIVEYEPGELYKDANVEPADDTLFAVWSQNLVDIYYTTDGNGTVDNDFEELAVFDGEAEGSTASPNEGYHFVNWTDSQGNIVGTDPTFVPEKVDGKNVSETYTANFAINNYEVDFDMQGHGDQVPSQHPNHGDKVEEPETPTADGYTFKNWYKDDQFAATWDFENDVVTEDTTLYGLWDEDEVPLHYNANGGTNAPADQTMKYTEKAFVSSNEPTRPGYTFYGWATTKEKADAGIVEYNKNSLFADENTVKVESTLYACWTENETIIRYKAEEGGSVDNAEDTVKVDTGTPAGSTATKDYGYDFLGWEDENGNIVSKDEHFVPSKDKTTGLYEPATYTATFDKHDFTVKFDTMGKAENPKDQKVEYLDKATKPENPKAEGYIIYDWYKDKELTDPWDFENDVVTEDITLYAYWTKIIVDPDDPTKPSSGISVIPPEDRYYTGEEIKPEDVIIMLDDKVLEPGTDYEIIGYEENIEIGEAYVLVQGKLRAFDGVLKVPFKILPVPATPQEATPNNAPIQTGSTQSALIYLYVVLGLALFVVFMRKEKIFEK